MENKKYDWKVRHTSEQGGQSPSQQRRLQAWRPQSRNVRHFLSQAKSWQQGTYSIFNSECSIPNISRHKHNTSICSQLKVIEISVQWLGFLPLSSSSHTGTTWQPQLCTSQRRVPGGTSPGTCDNRNSTSYHKLPHKGAPKHHKPSLHTLSSRKGSPASPGAGTPHIFPHDTLSRKNVSRTRAFPRNWGLQFSFLKKNEWKRRRVLKS